MLLDGAGIQFRDEFLQTGEEGGKIAAKKLSIALENYVFRNFPGLDIPKIIARMYVNIKALGETCVRGGITTEPSSVEEFARGFNSHPLFDLVDTGVDSAHEKIGGMHRDLMSFGACNSSILLRCFDIRADLPPAVSRGLQTQFIQLPLPPDIPGMLRG